MMGAYLVIDRVTIARLSARYCALRRRGERTSLAKDTVGLLCLNPGLQGKQHVEALECKCSEGIVSLK